MGKKRKVRQKHQQSPGDIVDDDTITEKINGIEIETSYKDEKVVSERTEFDNIELKTKRVTKEKACFQDKLKDKNEKRKVATKVKGFSNLGNTCFFNAVMQNLVQTPWLYEWLKEHSSKDFTWKITPLPIPDTSESLKNCHLSSTEDEQEPLEVTLSVCKPLTQAFVSFLQHVNGTNDSVVNPSLLFGQICKKSSQFKGHQQQDSHELLCRFLDSMKMEEIERQKLSILKLFNLAGKIDKTKVDEITKKKLKGLGPYASHTFVDIIFGGQLLSTVTCEECGNRSQIFEHFIDLSLPVGEEKPTRPNSRRQAVIENASSSDDKILPRKEGRKLSKHQETKMKRKQKKLAKKQEKAGERGRQKILLNESQGQEESEGDETEADVEDNIEVEVFKNPINETNLTRDSAAKGIIDSIPHKKTNININTDESDSGNDDIEISMKYFSQLTLTSDSCETTTNERFLMEHAELRVNNEKIIENRFCRKEMRESKDSLLEDEHDKGRYPEGCSSISSSPDKENINNVCTDSGISNGESDRSSGCGQNSNRKMSQRTLGPRYLPSSHECSILSCLNQFTAPELLTGNNKFGCENCSQKRHKNAGKSSEEKPKIVYTNANKQLLVFSPPAVLILHLKRFQQIGMNLKKVNRHVDFPLVLDIAPFCSSDIQGLPLLENGQKKILYSLYGVVEHIGRLTGGHYTAYVKERSSIPNASRTYLKQEPTDYTKFNLCNNNLNDTTLLNSKTFSEPPSGQWYYVNDARVSVSTEENVLQSQGYLLFYERIC